MPAVQQVDSPGSVPRRPRARSRTVLGLALLSLCATAPVLIPPYPQMADLAQHGAQVGLWRELGEPGFGFASLFHFNWFTPYLAGYVLVYALASLLGTVAACKAVVALALAAIPLATFLVMEETGADTVWAPLAVFGLYGFSYQWGLLNFIVATPIGLLFLWLVMRHLAAPRWTTAVELALMAVALFFCHALIAAFFCLAVTVYALFALGGLAPAARRLAPLGVVVPLAFAWSRTAADNPLAKLPILWDLNWFTTAEGYYQLYPAMFPSTLGWGRLTGLIPRLLGVQPTVPFIALGLLVLALPFLAGARPMRRAAVWMPLAVCLLAVFLVPAVLFGNSYTYQRFTVLLLPFYLAVFGQPADSTRGRFLRRAVPYVAIAWILTMSAQAMAFRAESRGFTEVLRAMEPGRRVLGLAFEWQSRSSIAPAFLHFSSWYAAERQGVVDPSFAVTYAPLVQYREGNRPRAAILGFEWNPGMFDWSYFQGSEYRYFLCRAFRDPGPFLRRTSPCALRLTAQSGAWWVYERDVSCTR